MNLIIVGMGGHARSWQAYLKRNSNWKIIGVVDTDLLKLQNPDSWGVSDEFAYPSIEDAVKYSEEKIDAVLLTTPIPTHHVLAIEALELGLNVICEKNMAQNIDEAREMVKAAEKHPELCTSMGTQYRYRPFWWTLHEIFTHGESPIGKLAEIQWTSNAKQGTMRTGWRAFLPDIYPADMMVHHMDCLRYCTGLEIIKVQAQVFRPNWSQWLGSSSVFANYVMAQPGKELVKEEWVYAQYHGDWQSRGHLNNWEDNFIFYGPNGTIRIEPPQTKIKESWQQTDIMPLAGQTPGSRIMSYIDSSDLSKTEIKEVPIRDDIENHPKKYIDQMFILEELAECIATKGKRQPRINFQEGYKSFLITQAAIESSQTGRTVWVPKYWLDRSIPEP